MCNSLIARRVWIGAGLVGCTMGGFWLLAEPPVSAIGMETIRDNDTSITNPNAVLLADRITSQPPPSSVRAVASTPVAVEGSPISFPQPVTITRSLSESFEEVKADAKSRAESAALNPFSIVH